MLISSTLFDDWNQRFLSLDEVANKNGISLIGVKSYKKIICLQEKVQKEMEIGLLNKGNLN